MTLLSTYTCPAQSFYWATVVYLSDLSAGM